MNCRTEILLHVPIGLKLQPRDVENLLAPELDISLPDAIEACLQSGGAREYLRRNPDWRHKSERILAQSEKLGVRWLTLADDLYPKTWRGLSTRPVIFAFRGEPAWDNQLTLSIVGSRTPSSDTLLWLQRELPQCLKIIDVVVVSGGARGVDQWAHRLTLDSGRRTICVLPSGLKNLYPPGNDDLWRKIVETGGCLISTCALDEPLRKSFFHIRNRWIAGMGPLCFVVEANRRSGSLLTAKLATEEGRSLCTLPVSPLASQGLGNLDLLHSGAEMIRDHLDLYELIALNVATQARP